MDYPTDARHIAEVLAEEIALREPGDRLSTEHELINRFGVPRSTVRKALDDLESRFLISRVQGSGTFVTDRIDYTVANWESPSLHSIVEDAGGTADTVLITSAVCPLPVTIAELFGVDVATPALRLERMAYINDEPSVALEEWLAPGVADNLDAALGVFKSVHESLIAFGHHPVRQRSRATIDDTPLDIRRQLGMAHPILGCRVLNLSVDKDSGIPLMATSSWFRLDKVRIIFDYR